MKKMINRLKKLFSPFSLISPHSHLLPLSEKIELGHVLKIDLHSHLIHGIDDGVKTMEETLTMAKKFAKLGYKKVITTPHMMQDRYDNSHEKINAGLAQIRIELLNRFIEIEIEAAAEYYLDEQFESILHNRDLLTFGDNYVLFEMSCDNQPKKMFDLVLEMQILGYKPVLAHPERYSFMHNNREIYKKLKKNGVFFQVDLLSFTTYHSFDVQRTALWLCNNSMIDFVGSDAHRIKHLNMIETLKSTSILKSVYEKNHLLNDTL